MPTPKTSSRAQERLFLLDGMALAYRAYFSFISRPLVNSRGENTSAIFGFVNTLVKILEDEKPDHVAVVFDTKEPTFRHIMYEPYKATREKMPEDMSGQMDMLKDVVKAFRVPVLELPGYEADDIMGTLARKAERAGIATFLVTGDKDFMQLISPLIRMYRPGKQGDAWETLDERAVMEKFGVTPDRVIDVLGLTGDSSDNVPGVPGIGEKTAIPLIREYGSIEALLDAVDKIPQNGVRKKLQEHRELALLSKKLVTIDVKVPLEVDLHHLNAQEPDRALLAQLFGRLEFRTLARRYAAGAPASAGAAAEAPPAAVVDEEPTADIASDAHRYHLVTTRKEFGALLRALGKASCFVFDTETTSTDPLQAVLVGLSFAVKAREAWYVPVREDAPPLAPAAHANEELFPAAHGGGAKAPAEAPGLDASDVLARLAPLFGDPAIRKIGQNIKYDMLVLAARGIPVRGTSFDTMVAHYVLRPEAQHNMDSMALEHLRYRTVTFDDLTGTGKDRKDIRHVPVERVADYSAEDADITWRLYETLDAKLRDQGMLSLCDTIEFPLIDVLADMERTGIALDTAYLGELSVSLEETLAGLTEEIHRHAGETFNINSTQQLAKILFEKIGLASVRKTKTGFSTDVAVLETLRHEHPVIEKLLEYRQLQKLKSTYVDALPLLVNPGTGRLHTSFNQTIAATGRLSSSNPNLQNIPIRTEIGRSIRKAFIPGGKGMQILSADYSQIELRVMAHISGDAGLREAFRQGEDIHASTAAKVFGVPPGKVTKEMRRKAKEVNFGIMYGIGPFGLATRLDIPQGEAKEIITRYFERFPGVRTYIDDTLARAKESGYVATLNGRRRYIPDLRSKNFNVRSNAERQAINMPIQGTAADMIKLAMIQLHGPLQKEAPSARMLLQVHDELVFEVHRREAKHAAAFIAKVMKEALPLDVPVEVESGIGANWLEAH
jgi:DNA polymerase-1